MTKGYQHLRAMCGGKIPFLTEAQADDHAREIKRRKRDTMQSYLCPVCGYFHTGHVGGRKK